jgi:hypothetical protein
LEAYFDFYVVVAHCFVERRLGFISQHGDEAGGMSAKRGSFAAANTAARSSVVNA